MERIDEIIDWIRSNRNGKNLEGMAKFGIRTDKAYGIPMPQLRSMAKTIGKDHGVALRLWDTGIHEARILAALLADPKQCTPELMDEWVQQIDSWDVCDQCCLNFFRYTPYVGQKISQWAQRDEEFIRRTAFSLMATSAVSNKTDGDGIFLPYLELIRQYSTDQRNFVKKAVNWALRQIGKRNMVLHTEAVALCEELIASGDRTARWIGRDALRELRSDKIIARIKR